jgi:hypothetical protein
MKLGNSNAPPICAGMLIGIQRQIKLNYQRNLCAFAPLRESGLLEASFAQRRKGAKAQSSQRFFSALSN